MVCLSVMLLCYTLHDYDSVMKDFVRKKVCYLYRTLYKRWVRKRILGEGEGTPD